MGGPPGGSIDALRGARPALVEAVRGPHLDRTSGPTERHDITVEPAVGLAGGACAGYGLLLDIKDPAQNIDWTVPEGGGGPNYPNM